LKDAVCFHKSHENHRPILPLHSSNQIDYQKSKVPHIAPHELAKRNIAVEIEHPASIPALGKLAHRLRIEEGWFAQVVEGLVIELFAQCNVSWSAGQQLNVGSLDVDVTISKDILVNYVPELAW
jgi:hypothetical protein